MVGLMKIMATSFKRSRTGTVVFSAPDPAAGQCAPKPPPETPGPSQASLGQSLAGSLLLSPGSWCTQGFVCPLQVSISPVLCKFWQLCGGVNGDLLQKIPCLYCYTHCPQPCSRPPPTHASTRDSWTLLGKSGSVSCGVTAPFSWVLDCKGFVCALQESVSPFL